MLKLFRMNKIGQSIASKNCGKDECRFPHQNIFHILCMGVLFGSEGIRV